VLCNRVRVSLWRIMLNAAALRVQTHRYCSGSRGAQDLLLQRIVQKQGLHGVLWRASAWGHCMLWIIVFSPGMPRKRAVRFNALPAASLMT